MKTILIVDDNSDIRVLLRRNLMQLGYGVVVAESGSQAQKYIASRAQNIDVVVSDILMPDGDGLWLLEQIRNFSKDIPVILISASSDHSDAKLSALGATAFLKKPLDVDELDSVIQRSVNPQNA